MTALDKLIVPERILELQGTDKDKVIREMVEAIARAQGMPGREVILQAMLEREALMSTGIGHGIAIPHCKDGRIKSFAVALGRTKGPLEYGSSDKHPVRLLAMIAAPDSRQDEYLRLLSRVTKFLLRTVSTLRSGWVRSIPVSITHAVAVAPETPPLTRVIPGGVCCVPPAVTVTVPGWASASTGSTIAIT